MPPPNASAPDPIDIVHLAEVTSSDPVLQRQVLGLFQAQSERIMRALANIPDDAATLAHTLKGSARAIGAFRVADAAEQLEQAVREEDLARSALMRLERELALARAVIDEILQES
jgi:HPt (histidine-containing phosphotransfer) domain-containing protein